MNLLFINKFLTSEPPIDPQWGTVHILWFVIVMALITVGTVLIGRFVKKEKTKDIVLIVSAVCLLVSVIVNRITLVYANLYLPLGPNEPLKWTSWSQIFPDSFCSLTSLVYSISILINRSKKNITFHGLLYFAIVGGFCTYLFPTWIGWYHWYTIRSLSIFAHHALLIWCSLILIVTNRFRPNPSYWYVLPIIFCIYITIGAFQIHVIGYRDSMDIIHPLLEEWPITGWWGCGIFYMIVSLVSEFSYYGYKCLLAKRLVLTQGIHSKNLTNEKVFCFIYYKKDKVLVICYDNNTYQAFSGINHSIVKTFKKTKSFEKNKYITNSLLTKHKQKVI